MSMELIQTVTTSGNFTLSMEFSSIPQTYTDLVLLASPRSSNDIFMSLRFNSSTSNFTNRYVAGEGDSVQTSTRTDTFVGYFPGPAQTSNTFGNWEIRIPNYARATNRTFDITYVSENNGIQSFQGLVGGLWSNTTAITSIQLFVLSNNGYMVEGSTASLYGITRGSDGIVTTS